MQEIKLLIEKFWAGTASEAEKKRLFQLMHERGGEWQQVMEEEYGQELADHRPLLTPVRSEEILKQLHGRITEWETSSVQEKGRVWPLRHWIGWAAAAVLVMGIGLGIYESNHFLASSPSIVRQDGKESPLVKRWHNKGSALQFSALPDGSVVSLYPGAELTYDETYGHGSRKLLLQGKAVFDVAKMAGAPFMVEAAGFTTTALGPRFMVNTQLDNRLSVVLFEGKVAVQGAIPGGLAMKDVLLAPGQELAVDLHSGDYAVNKWKGEDSNATASSGKGTRKAAPDYVFAFQRTPLDKVFHQLSEHYKVGILVGDADLEGLSFTGKILSTDDLQTVLSIICNTNDLTFSQENGKIKISKQK